MAPTAVVCVRAPAPRLPMNAGASPTSSAKTTSACGGAVGSAGARWLATSSTPAWTTPARPGNVASMRAAILSRYV